VTQTESGRFVLCPGDQSSGQDETHAHHVGISPQEDRDGTAGEWGEGEGAAEEKKEV
jgi:hypothetical protein